MTPCVLCILEYLTCRFPQRLTTQVGQLPFKTEPELTPVTATMSSTFRSDDHFRAAKCIDGNTMGPDVGESDGEAVDLCHTDGEPAPWLAIDFGTPVTVRRVELFNRIFCCAERTRNVEVRPSNITLLIIITIITITTTRCVSRTSFQPPASRCSLEGDCLATLTDLLRKKRRSPS